MSRYKIGERIFKCKSRINLFEFATEKTLFEAKTSCFIEQVYHICSISFQFKHPYHILELQYVTLDPLFCVWMMLL